MAKRKVILLPDDERILTLFKGNIGGPTKTDQAEETVDKKSVIDQDKRLWYQIFIEKTVLVILLPFLFLTAVVMTPMIIIGHLVLGKGGDAFEKKCFELFGMLENIIPFRKRNIYNGKSDPWKGVEEDVPGMLEKARRYNYHIVIYVKNSDTINISRIKQLQTTGWIDEVLEYNDKNELFIYTKNQDVCQQYSWIIEVPEFDIQLSIEAFKNILCIDKVPGEFYHPQRHYSTFKNASDRMIFSRIQLRNSPLLSSSTVLYFEKEYETEVNQYILKNYHHIQQVLEDRGLQLLHLPAIKNFKNRDVNFYTSFSYTYPDLFKGENQIGKESIEQWIKDFDITQLYAFFETALQIPELPLPGFIRRIESSGEKTKDELVDYSFFPIWGKDASTIKEEIDYYLSLVGVINDGPMYQLVGRNDFEYDPDYWFYSDGSDINEEIKNKIADIKKNASEKSVFEILFHIINEFKDVNPELCKKLCRQLYDESNLLERKLSRIYIDKSFRIFLLDYNNMEIEMTPLPKTLFLFILKYPNGVMLKELYKHKQDLLYIYGRISNRTDLEQMQNSINDMTNATSNSVNEKCSRIKEAFVSKIDDRIARSYYITGDRQEPKKISLERSLVVFEEMV
jgi:hypothetical protein